MPKNPLKKITSRKKKTGKADVEAATAAAPATQRAARRQKRDASQQERVARPAGLAQLERRASASEKRFARAPPGAAVGAAASGTESDTQRQERDARRRERSARAADADPAPGRSVASKTKSAPKTSPRERLLQDAQLGCCHKFGQVLVALVHLLDALLGLAFLVYGVLILTQFETPAMEAVITSLTYGSVVLFASMMGVIGFCSPRCKRIGLLVSAYTAILIVLLYVFAVIYELSLSSSIFDYLTEHMDVLYLNEELIATLQRMLWLFFVVLGSLTVMETCRLWLLLRLRATLVRFDDASRRIAADDGRASSKSQRSKSNASGSAKDAGVTPLLADEERGAAGGDDEDY